MSMEPGDKVTVLWGGARRTATVVKIFKNGKVKVQLLRGRWTGGRPGSSASDVNATVEAWQIVHEPMDKES